MLEEQFIEFSPGGTDLIDATILVDESDFAGVKIAARNLSQDFARVTKKDPPPVDIVENSKDIATGGPRVAIIVGSVESSRLLQRLERENGVQYSAIREKWESFLTVLVDKPLGGCFDKALVIAGSDKRGAIFGIYTLSEQIGVSP